jgi:hypothetical protein
MRGRRPGDEDVALDDEDVALDDEDVALDDEDVALDDEDVPLDDEDVVAELLLEPPAPWPGRTRERLVGRPLGGSTDPAAQLVEALGDREAAVAEPDGPLRDR